MTLFPDVVVEFSPTTDPLEEPVWEDVTQYLRSFDIDRGRSTELDRAEAGAATFVLDNNDGRFDPSRLDGPYYPDIRPMKRIRIRAFMEPAYEPFTTGLSFLGGPDVIGGSLIFIDLFSGFVEQWAMNWQPEPSPTTDATVSVRAVDAFKLLAIQVGQQGYAAQSGPLVWAILTDSNIGWPSSDIVYDVGGKTCNTSPADSSTHTLTALQNIDASEGGLFFMSRSGKFTFYNAEHIHRYPPLAADVWGDMPDENQYQSITIDVNDNTLWNEIIITSPHVGAGSGSAVDVVSQEKYLRRRLVVDTILSDFDALQQRAYEYILAFDIPRQRVTRLEVGVREDADWDLILRKDILDRIVVRRRPYEDAVGINQDSVIQGIHISSSTRRQWNVEWRVTATPKQNRLTMNQSTTDVDTSGWTYTNCTAARLTGTSGGHPYPFDGVLALTAITNGDLAATTSPNTQLAVVPGQPYTAMAGYYPTPIPTTYKDCRTDIQWRDIGGSVIATTTGNVVTEFPFGSVSNASFQSSYATAYAPDDAAYATVKVTVFAAETTQAHRIGFMGFYDIDEQYAWTPGVG